MGDFKADKVSKSYNEGFGFTQNPFIEIDDDDAAARHAVARHEQNIREMGPMGLLSVNISPFACKVVCYLYGKTKATVDDLQAELFPDKDLDDQESLKRMLRELDTTADPKAEFCYRVVRRKNRVWLDVFLPRKTE